MSKIPVTMRYIVLGFFKIEGIDTREDIYKDGNVVNSSFLRQENFYVWLCARAERHFYVWQCTKGKM